mgnify:CR=1 FL=1
MKNILIVGGAGYVGTKLCDTLISRGYNVKVIDLLWFGNNTNEKCDVIKKDVFSLTTCKVSTR